MVSIVVLRRAGDATQMLLLRREGTWLRHVWSYAAGHVVEGETAWQAALRELHEETGLRPERLYATSFCETFYARSDNRIEIVPAFVAWVAADAPVRLNHEHSRYRWLDLAEAFDAVPFGSQRDLIAHVRREFIERTPNAVLQIQLPEPPPGR